MKKKSLMIRIHKLVLQSKESKRYSSVHAEYYMAQIVPHCQCRWVQPNLGAFTNSKLQVKGNTNFHLITSAFFCYQDRQWILHLTKLGVKTKTVEIIYSDELVPRIEWERMGLAKTVTDDEWTYDQRPPQRKGLCSSAYNRRKRRAAQRRPLPVFSVEYGLFWLLFLGPRIRPDCVRRAHVAEWVKHAAATLRKGAIGQAG